MKNTVKRIVKERVFSRFILRNHVLSSQVNQKVVAFTFDDGPSPLTTHQLVDLFAEFQGKASFFFQGNNAEEHPEIVRYAFCSGGDIANHSYNHPHYDKVGAREMVRQIARTNAILKNITGVQPAFLRPPGHRFTQWQAFVIWARFHQLIVEANLAPMDWKHPDAESLSQFIVENVQPGTIVCLHDASPITVKALERVLPILSADGYKFLSLSELKAMGKFSPYRRMLVKY